MKIIKVRKDTNGDITNVMTDDGNIMSVEKAINLAEQGLIEGVNTGETKNNKKTLRSDRNDTVEDNLSNLPLF